MVAQCVLDMELNRHGGLYLRTILMVLLVVLMLRTARDCRYALNLIFKPTVAEELHLLKCSLHYLATAR